MHRATPANSSFRAYVAGGARATVPDVDDTKYMQESKGNFMVNEMRQAIEAPQNYGFTSVAADAVKDAMGKIQQCAETFINFMGGNRSFPVMGNMDDRRHRLFNLAEDAAKGAAGMYGLREWGQQFLINSDGMYMTGNAGQQQQGGQSGSSPSVGGQIGPSQTILGSDGGSSGGSGSQSSGQGYRIKLQLVDNKNGQQQGSGGGGSGSGGGSSAATVKFDSEGKLLRGWRGAVRKFFRSESGVEFEYDVVTPMEASGGGGASSSSAAGGSQTQQGMGQKTLHKEQSTTFSDMTNQYIHHARGNGNVMIQDGSVTTHYQDASKSTKADQAHVHISHSSNAIFVDPVGCWSSKPIQLKADNCSSGGGSSQVYGAMVVAPTLEDGEAMFAEFRELQERVRLLTDRIAHLEARPR